MKSWSKTIILPLKSWITLWYVMDELLFPSALYNAISIYLKLMGFYFVSCLCYVCIFLMFIRHDEDECWELINCSMLTIECMKNINIPTSIKVQILPENTFTLILSYIFAIKALTMLPFDDITIIFSTWHGVTVNSLGTLTLLIMKHWWFIAMFRHDRMSFIFIQMVSISKHPLILFQC